jgi:transcriptional regulator with XRE-family HTH domain
MSTVQDLKNRWAREPEFAEAYEALGPEFAIARALIEARSRAGLSQAEVAERMGSSQSNVARMESGEHLPSTRSLLRYAEAVGARLELGFSTPRRRRA